MIEALLFESFIAAVHTKLLRVLLQSAHELTIVLRLRPSDTGRAAHQKHEHAKELVQVLMMQSPKRQVELELEQQVDVEVAGKQED